MARFVDSRGAAVHVPSVGYARLQGFLAGASAGERLTKSTDSFMVIAVMRTCRRLEMKTKLLVGVALFSTAFAAWAAAGCPLGCC
jgi:hypothetical protein